MPSPLAAVFSGLSLDTNIKSASFDGSVPLSGSPSLTRGDLGTRIQVKYVVSNGHVQLIKTVGSTVTTLADFAPSELSADSNASLAIYTRGNVPVLNVPSEVFELHVPSISGVPLSYTRFGTYAKINLLPTGINPLATFVFGQPSTSRPTTGTASYRSDLFGAVVVPNGTNTQFYTLGDGHGSATFDANFGSGTVSTLITLDTDGGGNFGNLSGTGSITVSSPAFHGTLSGAATGEFSGAFFGPNAVEAGYVFEAQGSGFLTYGNVFGTTAPPP